MVSDSNISHNHLKSQFMLLYDGKRCCSLEQLVVNSLLKILKNVQLNFHWKIELILN